MFTTRMPVVWLMASLFLAACSGSYDADDIDESHDHEHTAALLFTDKNTPSVSYYDAQEDSFETLGDAWGNAGRLTLADNGLAAAILANGQVNFVLMPDEHDEESEEEEAHAEPEMVALSLAASQVISSQNHFVLLADSATSALVPVETLADAETAEEELQLANQTQAAVMLDEEDGYFLMFADGLATVYQLDGETLTATATSIACSDPAQLAQQEEMVVFNCSEGVRYLAIDGEGSFTAGAVASDTALTAPAWQAAGHGFFALENNVLLQLHTDEEPPAVEVADVVDGEASVSFSGNLCAIAIETEAQETLYLLNDQGLLYILALPDHDSEEESLSLAGRIQLDESPLPMSCDQLFLQGGAASAVAVDNQIGKAYLIDADDGPYHIHQRLNLPASLDVADFRILQEKAVEGHDHEE